MLAAILSLLGLTISAAVTGAVALYRVRTIDRRAADVDQVQALQKEVVDLWAENRRLRKELDAAREDCEICRADSIAMKLELERLRRVHGER